MGSMSVTHWLIVTVVLSSLVGLAILLRRDQRAGGLRSYAYRPSDKLAKVIGALLKAEIAVSLISIVAGVSQLLLLSRMDQDYFASPEAMQASSDANDLLVALIALAQLGLMLTLAFVVLRWIYRSNANARALGAKAMTYSPRGAIGWYFVPIVTLWKPFEAFREIWRVSARGAGDAYPRSTPLLGTWWALWIASLIVGQISFRISMSSDDGIETLRMAVLAEQAADAVTVALDLVFLVLVRRLTQMQTAWRDASEALAIAETA